MPIYEYKCPQCNEVIEEQRSIQSRDDPIYCKCGLAMEHILSVFNTRGKTSTSKSLASPEEHLKVRSPKPTGAAVRLEGGGVDLIDCRIENCHVGVSMTKDSKVNIQGTKFVNVTTPIEVRDK